MGFFSNIGNAISSGLSTLSSGFNAVCNTVSTIGKEVAEFTHNIKPVLGPILMTIAHTIPHPAVKAVALFANALMQGLSIFHPHENVQDMGDRALQASAQGITLDKFEKFDDYLAALRNFNLDPEVSRKNGPAEKLVAGLGVATVGIEQKFHADAGSLRDIWLLPLTGPGYFTADRVKSLLENGRLVGNFSAYLEKSMSGEEASAFRKNMEITPDGKPMNDGELGKLHDALDGARTIWAELKRELNAKD